MDRKETGRQKETEKQRERERGRERERDREREIEEREAAWGAEGGREEYRTHERGRRRKGRGQCRRTEPEALKYGLLSQSHHKPH